MGEGVWEWNNKIDICRHFTQNFPKLAKIAGSEQVDPSVYRKGTGGVCHPFFLDKNFKTLPILSFSPITKA